jgi:arylformamidase
MRIYDISAPLSMTQTPIYLGDPAIEINQWSSIANGDAANVSLLRFSTHTATHVDAPSHFIEGAPKINEASLDTLIGEARVIEIPFEARSITAAHVSKQQLKGATRVLFKTRNSLFWANAANQFREDFTFITPDAARVLVEEGVRLVGIDYLSVEEFKSELFETHLTLLAKSVVIIEGLDLREVNGGIYELICLPLRIESGSGDGAPARAVLRSLTEREV